MWGWSSGLGVVLITIPIVRTFKLVGFGQLWSSPEVNNLLLAYGVFASFGTLLLLLLNAAGILFEHTLTPYLVAVLLSLGASLLSFTRMLLLSLGRAA